MRDPITSNTPRPPRLRVHCPLHEKIRLFELLDSTDRLRLHTAEEVTPLYGSGLFAVGKSLEKDRMILDSRGANLLERPPNRWIRALAAGELLTRLVLQAEEKILCSGNDLKDFYYFFKATNSRSRRNVLVGGLRPHSVSHLKAFRPELLNSSVIFGGLATLAMGDTQAVELAQSCHLGVALQHGIITEENLMSLAKPPPRSSSSVGLVIDDFVVVSKVEMEKEQERSEGAELADRMLSAYKEVGLMPNEDKSFRDEAEASFWGADLDGRKGTVRGSLRRAIPVAALFIKILEVKVATAGLLQILTGCLISLFLYRRRFLCLLDSLFESFRGREDRCLVTITGQLRSDILMLVSLLPLAVSNLRAGIPQEIYASDASNWGEAAVWSPLEEQVGKELLRHTLKKSIWVRLLAPAAAWSRSHAMLDPEEETPGNEEIYRSNPLWELLARGLKYKELFSKCKSGQRHINIGELRAALKTEKIGGLKRKSSRLLIGLDSQVALGCLVKGRSSSKALNLELARSVPVLLALDSFPEYLYFNTKSNPSDDPTRGVALREPDLEMPGWWEDLKKGEHEELDLWLKSFGLDDMTLSELPNFDELRGKKEKTFSDGTLPEPAVASYPVNSKEKSIEAVSLKDEDRREAEVPRKNRKEDFVVKDTTRLKSKVTGADRSEAAEEEVGKSGTAISEVPKNRCGGSCPVTPEVVDPCLSPLRSTSRSTSSGGKKDEEKTEKEAKAALHPRPLRPAARSLLARIRIDKFVLPKGSPFPPEERGCLDLFSGERGVAEASARRGVWSLCYDLEHGADEDLKCPKLRKQLEELIEAGCFEVVGGGPVCASFSTAITPAVRDANNPEGKEGISLAMEVKVAEGNESAHWMFAIIELGLRLGLRIWLENPAGSWMFRLKKWQELRKRWPEIDYWTVDYCRFGKPWRKRTRFASTSNLRGKKTLCTRDHSHLILRGRSASLRQNWTRIAQAYPKGVAEALSKSLCMAGGWVEERDFDPSSCARCCGKRIGEASHPGPRRPAQGRREGLLSDVHLLEAKTRNIQSKTWGGFYNWLSTHLSRSAMESALAQPALLVLLLEEYGNYLYREGKSLFMYRHLVVFVQQNFMHAKPLMGPAWSMIARWEKMEPTVHRVPLPLAVFKAMLGVSLGWGWKFFAATLILGFCGITRASEPLRAQRVDLILPSDRLQPESDVAYLRLLKSKTSGRGIGRVQHASINNQLYVRFLERVYSKHHKTDWLNRCSPSAFRRRWDAVLEALGIASTYGLTPGGLRGGGCVAAFQADNDIPRLLWKMRLRHAETLQNYLQEVTASTLIASFSSITRSKVQRAAALGDVFVSAYLTANVLPY